MARKAAKNSAKSATTRDEAQDEASTGQSSSSGTEGSGGKVSKAAAVRAAIDAGAESPDDGVQFVKHRFGLEISKPHFSAIKSHYKSRGPGAGRGKPGRKPKSSGAAIEGYLAPPPRLAPEGRADLLHAMEAMKPLVASLGKEQVKRIVDLLG